MLYKAYVNHRKSTFHGNIATNHTTIAVEQI